MPYQHNPFTPGFGTPPLFLAGRKEVLDDMRAAFENGPGDPNLSTIFVGARGTGKTVLLRGIEVEAGLAGWVSTHVVAKPGMLERIYEKTLKAAEHLLKPPPRRQLTGIEVGQALGLSWSTTTPSHGDWSLRMEDVLDALEEHDSGLVIVVDEVKASIDEMLDLATEYQIFVGRSRRIALVMAGLPSHVSALVTNDNVSFLRRARHHYLERISDDDIELAFRMTVESQGKAIHDEALHMASQAIRGFPYMMQLVGYYSWALTRDDPIVTPLRIEQGIAHARSELSKGVFEITYRELSDGDQAFLHAMLEDPEESRLTDIARRMGKSTSYASSYKLRLLNQGIIEETLRRRFVFSMPFFREWLEHMGL